MIPHTQYPGLTRLSSPSSPFCKQNWKLLSSPKRSNVCSGATSPRLSWPRKGSTILSVSLYLYSHPIHASASYSEPRSDDGESLFLHILDEYPPDIPKSQSENRIQDLKDDALTSEGFEAQGTAVEEENNSKGGSKESGKIEDHAVEFGDLELSPNALPRESGCHTQEPASVGDVEPGKAGVLISGGFSPRPEVLPGRRQGWQYGRQLFLTGERNYQRWMPISAPVDVELPVEAPHHSDTSSRVGVSEEKIKAKNSDETGRSEFEVHEKGGYVDREVDLSSERGRRVVELEENSGRSLRETGGVSKETNGDLLLEFVLRRSEEWGDKKKALLREGDQNCTVPRKDSLVVGDPSVPLKNLVCASQQQVSTSPDIKTASSEDVRNHFLFTPGEALPTREHQSEVPCILSGEGNGKGLVEEILHIAKTLPRNVTLDKFLLPFHNEMTTNYGKQVLNSLGKERLAWPLLSFFQWLRFHESTLLDAQSFCILFTYLGNLGMGDQALVYYRNMPEDMNFHCVQVYNSLLGALVRSDRKGNIPNILQQMSDRNIERDSFTYSILINATKEGKERLESVWSVFGDLLREGLRPSVGVYGSLIKAFCEKGHLKQALLIFVSMEKMCIFPNVIIYNTLIDAHSKALQLEEAEGLLLEMRNRKLRPTECTYNALINGYGKNGQFDVAEDLIVQMQDERLKPNVVTYTSLMSAYGKQKMSEKALNVFLKMRKNGIAPSAHTYTVLINAYAEGGWHEKAQRAFDNMVREGLRPTIHTYTALLDGYRRSGDLEMVKHIWNTIKEDGCDLTRVAYNTIVDAFSKYGQYMDARDVMDEFRKRGFPPDTMTFNMLLNAYARGGLRTKLPKILREMDEAGCQRDSFTYCTLIYACLRLRDFTSAFKYDQEMITLGHQPEPRIYWKMRKLLDAKYALKLENDQKADAGHVPGSQPKLKRKNPQKAKRGFKRYMKVGTERAKALWKRRHNT